MGNMIKVIECESFTAGNGVFSITAAFNNTTKEARIYAEFERIEQRVLENHLAGLGAASIVIDAFSSSEWETESAAAYESVIQCGGSPGFSLLRHGSEARAAVHSLSSIGSGGQGSGGVSGYGQSADSGQDDRTKRKRQDSPTIGGDSKGDHFADVSFVFRLIC